MTNTPNILFLCTGNSARSIMAEGLLNHMAQGRYKAYSAGSHPTGSPHPMAIKTLTKFGIDTGFARSKSWDEFDQSHADAIKFDLVVTVCGNARDEVCPIWHGAPIKTHWGMEDPAKFEGSHIMQEARFDTSLAILRKRIKALLAHETMPKDQAILDKMGELQA